MKKSVTKNTIFYIIKNITTLIFPLITFPYVSRVLQPEGMGINTFANSFVSYFTLLAGLGISSFAIREGSKIRDQRTTFEQFASELFSVNIISSAVSYLLLLLIVVLFPRLSEYRVYILMFSVAIPLTTIGLEWVFNVYEEYDYITIRSIVFQCISFALLFILVKDSDDLFFYCLIQCISGFGSNILNFFRVRKYVKLKFVLNSNTSRFLKPVFVLFFSSIASQIYINSDVLMIGLMKNEYDVGLYNVSMKLYNMIRTVIASFITVITPSMSNYLATDVDKYHSFLKKYTSGFFSFVLAVSIGLFFEARDIIYVFSGTKYLDADISMKYLSVALLFSCMGSFVANEVLLLDRREKKILLATIVGAFTNILLNVFFIWKYSFTGAALTTAISEIIVFMIQCYFSRDLIKSKLINLEFFKSLVGGLIICCVCIVTQLFLKDTIVRLFLTTAFSVIAYFVILTLFKHSGIVEILEILRKKFSRKLTKDDI